MTTLLMPYSQPQILLGSAVLFVAALILIWISIITMRKNKLDIDEDLELDEPITVNTSEYDYEPINEDKSINLDITNTTIIPKQPFIDTFFETFEGTQIDTHSIVDHFLLSGVFLTDAILEACNIVAPQLAKNVKYLSDKKLSNKSNLKSRGKLSQKDINELRLYLEDIDILPELKKEELITLILSNTKASNKFLLEERRYSLMKKTNQDLKKLLLFGQHLYLNI